MPPGRIPAIPRRRQDTAGVTILACLIMKTRWTVLTVRRCGDAARRRDLRLGPGALADDRQPDHHLGRDRVNGSDALAVRVSKKLRAEEGLITVYSGARLRMDLDRVPLWRGDHVGLKQLWADYSQYLYLPRLRDSAVLLQAVRDGVALLTWNHDTFGYASAFDEETGRYTGLVAGEHAAVVLDNESVLVKPDVAARQIDTDRAAVAVVPGEGSGQRTP